jgi:hypothetical protein
MKHLLAVCITFITVSASAQWLPSGATSGPINYGGGNVGIGTTTPSEALHVVGNAKVTGALRVGKYSFGPVWFNTGGNDIGYMKLVTPIVFNEGNYFTIEVTGYHPGADQRPVHIRCSGYANATTGAFVQAGCYVDGTPLAVELTTEERTVGANPVVVLRLGNSGQANWAQSRWSVAYTGDLEKSASGFVWVKGETTPAAGPNMNNAVIDDMAGTLALGAILTGGTRVTVGGTSHLNGNVGIGIAPHATYALTTQGAANTTSFPSTPLTMSIISNTVFSTTNNGSGIAFGALYDTSSGPAVIGAVSAVKESNVTGNYAGALTFGTRAAGSSSGNMERMRIRSTGEVVIGQTGNTGTKLTVNGDAVATGNISANNINAAGNLTVTGNINASGNVIGARVFNAVYQDIAEWVPATEDMTPGTVVVLSPANVNEVMPSGRPYDTSVAGVVSEQPGVLLGVGGASKEQIATTGRVKVRVDATAAPISIGDLLVTSGASGTAMKSIPVALGDTQIHRPGTIIGKALEPLDSGTGEILVLLSLQ